MKLIDTSAWIHSLRPDGDNIRVRRPCRSWRFAAADR